MQLAVALSLGKEKKITNFSQRKLRQENCKLKVCLGYQCEFKVSLDKFY